MDIDKLMAQAKELQDKVAAAQDVLAETVVKGIAGNGLAVVQMDGKYNLRQLTLSPELSKESLDDISSVISAALNDAKQKVDATVDRIMGAATGGMQLPE